MSATLIIEATPCADCRDGDHDVRNCIANANAFKAMLRMKNPKPAGYAWKLWHESTDRAPKPLPKPGVYPAWAWGSPNKLVADILRAAVKPSGWHQQCLDDYAAGSHPWGTAPEGTP